LIELITTQQYRIIHKDTLFCLALGDDDEKKPTEPVDEEAHDRPAAGQAKGRVAPPKVNN